MTNDNTFPDEPGEPVEIELTELFQATAPSSSIGGRGLAAVRERRATRRRRRTALVSVAAATIALAGFAALPLLTDAGPAQIIETDFATTPDDDGSAADGARG